MKFIALSDTHGQHRSKKLNKFLNENLADVLLFAGDLQCNHFDDGLDFLDWLHNLPYKYKVMIFGNHDGNFEYVVEKAKEYNDIVILNNNFVIIENITIWGSPYSLPFLDWWFMKPDIELEEIYKTIPYNTNIILTHTPAFGILDMTNNKVLTGSISLLNRIKNLNTLNYLKYHICGHIHEQSGTCEMNNFLELKNVNFINASVLNEKYQLVHDPIIFNINSKNLLDDNQDNLSDLKEYR
jgi:Icc-related predicted phosphoesterase